MGRFLPRLSARLHTLAFIVLSFAVVVSGSAAFARQTDVTNSVTITKSAMVLNRGTQTYDLRVTLKNKTTSALLGPVQLAVNISGAGVTLLNADGATDSGTPYISFANDAGQLDAAKELVRVLRFKNPQAVKFSTTFSVLANIGNVFFPGQNVTVTSKPLDATGGELKIEGTGTPADGIVVSVPAGALNKATTFSIGYNTGTLSVRTGTPAAAILLIDAGSVHDFALPVTITVPFDGTSSVVPVPYFIDPSGQLKLAQLLNVDRTAHTFTFQTFHASLYSWVVSTIASLGATFTTAYAAASDGFQIVNFGSSYNREGECFGMTSFSLWFYENHKASAGPFYPKYFDILATDSLGRPLRGQNIIATRSFISITQQWTSYYPLVSSQINLTPAERLASIENALLNTNNPVLIYLFGNGTSAHSVLAYGFESLSNLAATVSVYDPNVPGDATRKIVYNGASGFSPYSGFPGIIYSGDGSLNLTEPYQHILDDADQNFHNSADATLNVTSHSNGQTVPERNITLAGTINSSQVLVTKLTVLVGSTSYSANVGLDGAFSIPIELNTGVNHLQFATQGNDASGNLIPVPNTLATTDFTLIADVANSIVLMTLTWDTNDSDIDTYVIDPSGDYSAYYHKDTADGGMLDRDVTTGFGPEHWTLRTTDTIRYGQPYKFRIHYFSDHGHGPSNYTVTIKLYEGTPREATFTYRGNLSVSNPQNNLPDGQGADWVDIASFTLTQQPAPQNLLRTPNAAASAGTVGESKPDIVITAPIPPASQRMKR